MGVGGVQNNGSLVFVHHHPRIADQLLIQIIPKECPINYNLRAIF